MMVILQLSQCLALVYTEFLSIYVNWSSEEYVTHVKAHSYSMFLNIWVESKPGDVHQVQSP